MWSPFPISNYPPGVNDNTPGAPWNDNDCPEIEHTITVSCTFSFTRKVIAGVELDTKSIYKELESDIKGCLKEEEDVNIDDLEIVEDEFDDPNDHYYERED
jgi:hypothetical protein